MDYFKEIAKVDPVNHYLVFTKDRLLKLKENINSEDIKQLEIDLSYLLRKPYYTVTSKDKNICFGINNHNYISLATYYWPNPETIDNLPYIQRDGYPNPEGDKYDKDKLRETAFIIYYELLLYYLTDNKEYYYDMKRRLYVFFLLAKTKMLPNMSHAQMIKGKNLGRGIGIIDFSANMTYSVILLKTLYDLGLVDNKLYNDFKNWLKPFYKWLTTDLVALEEMVAHNNHGTMYDFLLLSICYYLELDKDINLILYRLIDTRLFNQVASDGSLPLELARTKSKSYSMMGLKGFTDSAILLKEYGFNLYDLSWYFKDSDNYILNRALNYILNNLILEDNWNYEQVAKFDESTKLPLLLEGYFNNLISKEFNFNKMVCIDNILKIIITNLLK